MMQPQLSRERTRPTPPCCRGAALRSAGARWLALPLALAGLACGGLDIEGEEGGSSSGAGSSGGSSYNILSGALDAGEVYFIGSVDGCEEAVSPADDPDSIAFGFDCTNTDAPRIDPSDGSLLYAAEIFDSDSQQEVLLWVADPFPFTTVPQHLLDNDLEIFAPCPASAIYLNILALRFSPDGSFFYHCESHGWFDGLGSLVYDGSDEIANFANGLALLRAPYLEFAVYDLVTTATTTVTGVSQAGSDEQATRGLSNGFWVTNPIASAGDELWEIDAAGNATLVGSYPPEPANFDPEEAALDDSGNLYRLGFDTTGGGLDNLLIRASIGGASWTELFRESGSDPDRRIDLLTPGLEALFTGS